MLLNEQANQVYRLIGASICLSYRFNILQNLKQLYECILKGYVLKISDD